MKKNVRLIALLLALLLALQCAAAAAEPGTEAALPGEEPVPGESGNITAPQVEFITNITDGQTFDKVEQILTVAATADGEAVDPAGIAVRFGGKVIEPSADGYHLRLKSGDNAVVLSAAGAEKVLNLRLALNVPSGWAHDALVFCVEQGILNGDKSGDLTPTASATRAQLAAMLVRMFGAKEEADLSRFTDVKESAWYYAEFSRAVAMGLFEGSGNKLTPNNKITREQAFTVLSRAFGVAAESTDALDAFSDSDKVSTWAQYHLAGMLEAGYIHGNTNGTLNPKGYITRQELAQVLYNALDVITDDPDELTGKRNLYTGPIEGLTGRTIDGDLILCSESGENVTLEGFTVTGRLVLQLENANKITLSGVCDEVSACRRVRLILKTPLEKLTFMKGISEVSGDVKKLTMAGQTTFGGSFDTVVCLDGAITVGPNGHIETLELSETRSNAVITVNGTVGEIHARTDGVHISGSGQVGTLYQYRLHTDLDCEIGSIVDRIDAGLDGIGITPVDIPQAFYDAAEVTVTGKVTGVNTSQVYGVPGGVRTCTVTYSYNDKVLKTEKNFKLTEGAVLSCKLTAKMKDGVEAEQKVKVTITYGDESFSGNLCFIGMGRHTDLFEARCVETIRVQGTMKYTATIYANSSLTNPIGTLAAGTSVYYLNYGGVALVETSGGLRGYCADSAVSVWVKVYNDAHTHYSDAVKTLFVNEVHDYSSPSKYLIWINLYSTTINIFEGSKGNWKLIKSSECDIGRCTTPTRPGVYHIYSHAYYWSFDTPDKLDYDRCYYASLFDGGIATHTQLYYTETGAIRDNRLGLERTHGCIRCPDDIAMFIYYQCPIGTTVVVY